MNKIEQIENYVLKATAYMNDGYNAKEAIGCLENAFALVDNTLDIGYYKIIIDSANGLTYSTKNAIQTGKVRKIYVEFLTYLVDKYKKIENLKITNDQEEFDYITDLIFYFYNRIDYLASTFVKGTPVIIGALPALIGMKGALKPFFEMLGNIAHSSIVLMEKYNDDILNKQKYIDNLRKFEKKYYKG